MAKVVFMGTPDFAVPTLKALMKHHDVTGVVTQPDRPAGRAQEIRLSPIKQLAVEALIPVFQPEKIRHKDAVAQLKQWEADVYVVAAFGQILPQEVLDIPPHGSINVHASLLPRWRGAAPIQAAIRAGDHETGITIMKMDAGLDTGPMLSMGSIYITFDDTGQSLHDRLAQLGADLLTHTLPGYLNGAITPQPQPEHGITYAPQIKKEDGLINWSQDPFAIDRTVRAFTPWPGTFTHWNGKMLKIISGTPISPLGLFTYRPREKQPEGYVIHHDERVAVVTGDGLYYLETIQLAGKKVVSAEDFVRGQPTFMGSILG